ncbi:PREDICTED: trypsin epsilon-like [Ceratosolen solmsi marchali]|uniref:Trypsin epsilon-like n=1 Tax=Ceratosolen solmsi marchali TaxID=326594 RepID=A0AAJ6YQD6_9HYME|nr:PREDICTED: trypsin epsilon-like [Ceratosolen solmsi marchali]
MVNIVGGDSVDIKHFPYQVAIIKLEKLWCSGSIISQAFTLTAAHCVIYASSPLTIHAGTTFWAKPGSVHQVDRNITYGFEKYTDVAILHVIEPFIFDETRRAIPLFKIEDTIKVGTMAIVSGWGITETGELSDNLRAVEVPIVDRQACNISYSGIISDSELCAGSTGKDSCTYDSGGPLVIDGRQAGIVSMGSGCGGPIYRGIYADIAFFSEWITRQLSNNAAHCVLETLDISLIIHAGTSFWAKPGSIHHVESSTTYGASENVDVAVLRVTEPFVFDKKRQPIRLSPSGGVIKPFTIATVVGWGSTEKFEVSDVLLAVDVPIIDRRLCNISYHGNIAISEICAGSTHKDSCRGDSGGPLLVKGIQIGIISTGIGCGLTAFPGIYADVSYFHDWIMQQIYP